MPIVQCLECNSKYPINITSDPSELICEKCKKRVLKYIAYYSKCSKCKHLTLNLDTDSKCPDCSEELIDFPYEYSFNKYIKLKLNEDNGDSEIYVNDLYFSMCKYIILGIPKLNKELMKEQKYYENIDEAINNLEIKNKIELDKYEEFKGHCSNIAIWVENDYNCDLLSRSLSIPLITKLATLGDSKAISSIKLEVIKKIESKDKKVIQVLINENLFRFFTKEELKVLFSNTGDKLLNLFNDSTPILKNIRGSINIDLFNAYIKIGDSIKFGFLDQFASIYEKKNPTYSLKSISYKENININERNNFIKVRIQNRTYYDFNIIYNSTTTIKNRSLLPYECLHLAHRLCNKSKDTTISIPNENQPFKVFSNSQNLVIYIKPNTLTHFIINMWKEGFLKALRKKHIILKKSRENINYYENLTKKLRYFLRKTDFKIKSYRILGKKRIGLQWVLITKEETRPSLYSEIMGSVDTICDFIKGHNLIAHLKVDWCYSKVSLTFYISDKEGMTMKDLLFPNEKNKKVPLRNYRK